MKNIRLYGKRRRQSTKEKEKMTNLVETIKAAAEKGYHVCSDRIERSAIM